MHRIDQLSKDWIVIGTKLRVRFDNPKELLRRLSNHGGKTKGPKEMESSHAQGGQCSLLLHESGIDNMNEWPLGSIGDRDIDIGNGKTNVVDRGWKTTKNKGNKKMVGKKK